jgi:hypothetical protein
VRVIHARSSLRRTGDNKRDDDDDEDDVDVAGKIK